MSGNANSNLLVAGVILGLSLAAVTTASSPNIIFIVADDLGWNDIGFNNPDIISPNIDKLAKEGVILNQTYVQPLCSPSRSALMTGVYPFRLGLQHLVIFRGQPVCVPLNRTLLPEVLKKKGYATHMVGKWHLGFCNWKCTPTYRGFDSFFGYYNSREDYYTKVYDNGYDFRDNEKLYKGANGTYSTDLYTQRIQKIIQGHNSSKPLFLYLPFQNVHEPLEVPKKYSDMYPNITNMDRKTFSGMVTALDDAVGMVVNELKQKGINDNTLIVFTADNGGWVTYAGNNYPLRGGKFTVFEGGTRAVSFIHGSMLKTTGVRYDGLMHLVDWLPTLAEAAGVSEIPPDMDGVSQWQSLLSQTVPSKRREVVYNMDLTVAPFQGRAAIRVDDYKLVAGFPGIYPDWYKPAKVSRPPPMPRIQDQKILVDSKGQIDWEGVKNTWLKKAQKEEAPIFHYLFNLKDDPEERVNIYDENPDIVKKLLNRLEFYQRGYVPPNFPGYDNKATPSNWGGAWTPGWC